MKYTKKQFIADVTKEVKALKKNATKKELAKLDFEELYPQSPVMCIYGQITGECTSKRASKLINDCCEKYFHNNLDNGRSVFNEEIDYEERGMEDVCKYVNGSKIEGVKTMKDFQVHRNTLTHLSSIETYILTPKAKNKNLIDYLQDKRKDLVL